MKLEFLIVIWIQIAERIASKKIEISHIHGLIENGTKCIDIIDKIFRLSESNKFLELNKLAKLDAAILDDYYKATGSFSGKLHCVPILINEDIDVKGMSTRASWYSKESLNSISNINSITVEYLKKEGAVIIAKFNPIANKVKQYKKPSQFEDLYEATLVSGVGPIGLIADTEGSFLNSSTISGLYGIRPSLDESINNGIVPFFEKLDTICPMATSLHDLLLAYGIMINQPNIFQRVSKAYLSNLKVGYLSNFITSAYLRKKLNSIAIQLKKYNGLDIYEYEIDDSKWNGMNELLQNVTKSRVKCQTSCFLPLNEYLSNLNNNSDKKFNQHLSKKTNLSKNSDDDCKQNCPLFEFYRTKFTNLTINFFAESKADVFVYPTVFLPNSNLDDYNDTAYLSIYSGLPSISIPFLVANSNYSIGLSFLSLPENFIRAFKLVELF
jgi:Asp-tRNA(Asn)/Glu-tRNA(Gln) amidotransferase A subunit family amidase